MAAQQQFRRLIINRAVNFPCAYSFIRPKVNSNASRPFSASQASRAAKDSSSIDFAYMPQFEIQTPSQSEILRVPILPSNSTAPGRSDEADGAVIRPEITTVSASGTHIDSPSAMSEVTDNDAIELSPFDLTDKVMTAATAAASKVTGISAEKLKEPGVIQDLWSGLLDDILGAKKIAKA